MRKREEEEKSLFTNELKKEKEGRVGRTCHYFIYLRHTQALFGCWFVHFRTFSFAFLPGHKPASSGSSSTAGTSSMCGGYPPPRWEEEGERERGGGTGDEQVQAFCLPCAPLPGRGQAPSMRTQWVFVYSCQKQWKQLNFDTCKLRARRQAS